MKPGVHKLTDKEYNALEAARWSNVRMLLDCPAAYNYALNNKTESTSAQHLGTLVHAMVLEPETVAWRFVEAVKVDRRTKAGKAAWQQQLLEAEGRELVSADTWKEAVILSQACRTALDQHLPGWEDGRKEVAVLGNLYGNAAKCKIDLIVDNQVWDVKTTRDLSPRAFTNACYNYAYYGQVVTYTKLLQQFEDVSVGGIIAVQTTGVPLAHVLEFSERAKALGFYQHDKAWSELAVCQDSESWPGYDYDGTLEAPLWWSP